MNKVLLSAICFVSVLGSAHANASDDSSISGFQKGMICQAIDHKYPGKFRDSNGVPGWINCRDEGRFMKIDENFGVMVRIADRDFLSCNARLNNEGGRRPVANVKCKVVSRR